MADYLYNGTPLPALPEWDRETYPYAYITYTDKATYLTVSTAEPVWETTLYGIDLEFTDDTSIVRYKAGTNAWEWISNENNYVVARAKKDDPTTFIATLLWANVDTLDSFGSLLVSASTPIPVTTWTPDPISMTMGWLVGRRIAGQRGKKIPDTTVATLTDGVLYIQNASAVLNSGVLEVT